MMFDGISEESRSRGRRVRQPALSDLNTNVNPVRGKPQQGARARGTRGVEPAQQGAVPPPRTRYNAHDTAPHIALKGVEQTSHHGGSDAHLSIAEVTHESASDMGHDMAPPSPVRIGTSFLERPWLPPDSTTSSEEQEEQEQERRREGREVYGKGQSEGAGGGGGGVSVSPQGAHPSPALPLCDCCNSAILGKYYEKFGVTVHVECFKLYLKEKQKRKSPHPRRAPPPCPTDTRHETQKGGQDDGTDDIGTDSRGGTVEREWMGNQHRVQQYQHQQQPRSEATPPPLHTTPANAPRTTEVMERLMPRDSDGSGSWLAHPGSLEPVHTSRYSAQGNLPPPSPSHPGGPQRQYSTSPHQHRRPPITPSPPKGAGTGALHSLTVSPEAMESVASHPSHSHPFVHESRSIQPLQLDDSDAVQGGQFNLGSISPIHGPADGVMDGEELQLDADVRQGGVQGRGNVILEDRDFSPISDSASAVTTTTRDVSPLQPSVRYSVNTPVRQYDDLAQSPPSKALSTKLESPETPQTDAHDSSHSVSDVPVMPHHDSSDDSAIVSHPRTRHTEHHADEEESEDHPLRPPHAPEPPLQHTRGAFKPRKGSEPRHAQAHSPGMMYGEEASADDGPALTAADLLLSEDFGDAHESHQAQLDRQFDAQQPDFSLVSQCAVTDSPSPVKRAQRPLQATVVAIRPSPSWSSTRRSSSANVSPVPLQSKSLPTRTSVAPAANETVALKARVAELEAEAVQRALKEKELLARLQVAEESVTCSPAWEREASRVLRELISAKVELATLKTGTNPLTMIRPSVQCPQPPASMPHKQAPSPQSHPPSVSPRSRAPSVSPPRSYKGNTARRGPIAPPRIAPVHTPPRSN